MQKRAQLAEPMINHAHWVKAVVTLQRQKMLRNRWIDPLLNLALLPVIWAPDLSLSMDLLHEVHGCTDTLCLCQHKPVLLLPFLSPPAAASLPPLCWHWHRLNGWTKFTDDFFFLLIRSSAAPVSTLRSQWDLPLGSCVDFMTDGINSIARAEG